MTRKKLESYHGWLKRSEDTYRKWEDLNNRKLRLGSEPDSMPKSLNKRAFDEVIAKIDEVAEEYWNEYLEALNALEEIRQFISSLADPMHRNIFELKYIGGDYSIVVGGKVGYSRVHIERIITEVLNGAA